MTPSESPISAPALALPPGSLVLASSSPRRREILSRLELKFEIRAPDVDETALEGESPVALVLRLSEAKARAVAGCLSAGPGRWVLGSDTVVVLDEEIIGKPRDAEDAVGMLLRLTGRTHRVVTGIAVVDARDGSALARAVESKVIMRAADEAEIRAYVATGEPLDKAGAYAVQGEGRRFVDTVVGSESNVIGLPDAETLDLLARAMDAAGASGRAP